MAQTSNSNVEDLLAEHRAQLQASGLMPMTVDEILAGQTQAGVAPPPSFIREVEDDGTAQFVGSGKDAHHG